MTARKELIEALRGRYRNSPSVVSIVDDDAAVREALSSLLRSVGREVRTFASASEFLATTRPSEPACLVLDVSLDGESGLEPQETLNQRGDPTPIVFMTGHGDTPMSVRAMKAGAVEFLAKPFRDQELLDAVDLALQRDASQLHERTQLAEWRRRIATLPPRAREVMSRVVRGTLNKKIAAELAIAEITVKVHSRHVMEKMGAQSLADLVRMVDRAEPGLAGGEGHGRGRPRWPSSPPRSRTRSASRWPRRPPAPGPSCAGWPSIRPSSPRPATSCVTPNAPAPSCGRPEASCSRDLPRPRPCSCPRWPPT